MTADKSAQEFLLALKEASKNPVPITTSFKHDNAIALLQYTVDSGANKPQDVIRDITNRFLKAEGYLK